MGSIQRQVHASNKFLFGRFAGIRSYLSDSNPYIAPFLAVVAFLRSLSQRGGRGVSRRAGSFHLDLLSLPLIYNISYDVMFLTSGW